MVVVVVVVVMPCAMCMIHVSIKKNDTLPKKKKKYAYLHQ